MSLNFLLNNPRISGCKSNTFFNPNNLFIESFLKFILISKQDPEHKLLTIIIKIYFGVYLFEKWITKITYLVQFNNIVLIYYCFLTFVLSLGFGMSTHFLLNSK